MAAPAKTSDESIVAAARGLVEHAHDEFSMAAVAEAVGVRTPSLYKRFADREALLARVRRDAYDALRVAIVAGAKGRRGMARLRALAYAYRAFALARPRLYALLFAPEERSDAATHEARVASAAPALEALREIVGPEHALNAARTFTAFLHGHVTMILANAFQLGGDVEAAFDYGIDRLIAGLRGRA
jgi:AcrR family transcriptional regulator